MLLFPSRGELHEAREKEEKEAPEWEGDSVWWIKQTVGVSSHTDEGGEGRVDSVDPKRLWIHWASTCLAELAGSW